MSLAPFTASCASVVIARRLLCTFGPNVSMSFSTTGRTPMPVAHTTMEHGSSHTFLESRSWSSTESEFTALTVTPVKRLIFSRLNCFSVYSEMRLSVEQGRIARGLGPVPGTVLHYFLQHRRHACGGGCAPNVLSTWSWTSMSEILTSSSHCLGNALCASSLTRSAISAANSTPVGPPPTTTKCSNRLRSSLGRSGIAALSKASETAERMRRASGSSLRKWACLLTPGMPNVFTCAPTATTSLSYCISSVGLVRVLSTTTRELLPALGSGLAAPSSEALKELAAASG
mmetsp:Transcript_24740/g.64199  ORF Transcript_24740/g.64199 Transcript_24740/m.64199 type:complete len:287 (+) Transcript_24740:810-1670(+)